MNSTEEPRTGHQRAERTAAVYGDAHAMRTAANQLDASALARVRALAEQWNATPDYAPSAYDQGRVDQRHDMTTQLLEALGD